VDARIRNQVGLKLVEVHIESTIEAQARSNGTHDLSNQAVQVLVIWARNVQISLADFIDGFVVDQEGAVRMLNRAMRREDGIIRLNDRRRHAGRRIDGEFKLALFAVVGRQALKNKGAESGSSAASKGVENEEALEGLAAVCGESDETFRVLITYQQRGECGRERRRRVLCQLYSVRERPCAVRFCCLPGHGTYSYWRRPLCR
jgi:hypothetical protein